MTAKWIVITAILSALCLSGCEKPRAELSPVGVWSVRHEGDGGSSSSTITIESDGRFSELLEIEMTGGQTIEPKIYQGDWRMEGEEVTFKRDGANATDKYVLNEDGFQMSGVVGGIEIALRKKQN